ncbi:MAG: hypothetical protein AAFQ29_02820 [Pseudomonadota bacterium]
MRKRPFDNELAVFRGRGRRGRYKVIRHYIHRDRPLLKTICDLREIGALETKSALFSFEPPTLGTDRGFLSLGIIKLNYGPAELETGDEQRLRSRVQLEFSMSHQPRCIEALLNCDRFQNFAEVLSGRVAGIISAIYGQYGRREIINRLDDITHECEERLRSELEGFPQPSNSRLGIVISKLVITPGNALEIANDDRDNDHSITSEVRRLARVLDEFTTPAKKVEVMNLILAQIGLLKTTRIAEANGTVMVVPSDIAGYAAPSQNAVPSNLDEIRTIAMDNGMQKALQRLDAIELPTTGNDDDNDDDQAA